MTDASEFLINFLLFCVCLKVARWRLTELTSSKNDSNLKKAADKHFKREGETKKKEREKQRRRKWVDLHIIRFRNSVTFLTIFGDPVKWLMEATKLFVPSQEGKPLIFIFIFCALIQPIFPSNQYLIMSNSKEGFSHTYTRRDYFNWATNYNS